MKFAYARFVQTVASPGHPGSDVASVYVRATQRTLARESLVDSIEEDGLFIVLTSARTVDGKTITSQRYVPMTNVRDLEPLDETKTKKAKDQ